MTKEELIKYADKARELSYSPYSHYAVGAAILLKDGKVIVGANIENASYGLSMCAERNTVFRTLLSGYKKEDMVAMALTAQGATPPYPCGACRQVLSELFPLDAPIYISNLTDQEITTNVKELLPYIFDKESMNK